MASKWFLVSFFVIILSFSNCFARFLGGSMRADHVAYDHIHDHDYYRGNVIKDFLMSSFKRSLKEDSSHESSAPRIVRVDDFGAKGNGESDDTNAFNKAWEEACSSKHSAIFEVPKNNQYLVKPIRFKGPCKSGNITVRIFGTINASEDRSDYEDRHWLLFDEVQNLTVEGSGTINGNGAIWWKHSCKINKTLPCTEAPTALTFQRCESLIVRDLRVKDAQQIQVAFEHCNNVNASNLNVNASGHSPNTDGIHVTHTTNIAISNCSIATGDDCISIVSGSQTVRATDITCGPGHGISIGSLGAKNSEAHVSDVIVNRARLSETTNGLRIKTWQGGSGSANNIKFLNVEMHNVKNPIIIDQNYCDQRKACTEKSSAVQVSNVLYKNITGTSASTVAIRFDCSKGFQCEGIVLQDVHIQHYGDQKHDSEASCDNVELTDIGVVTPLCHNVANNNTNTTPTSAAPSASPLPNTNHHHHHHNHHHRHHHE